MIDEALDQARQLARLQVAKRCQTDLYYLCKYILGYDLMQEHTHRELCTYTSSLLAPHSTPIGSIDTPRAEISHDISGHTEKILENNSEVITSPDNQHDTSDQFDPQKNFLLLLMPRGTFKSSVVTIGFSIQTILNDPDARILIDSETFAKCTAFLAEIKGHLEGNDKLREVYYTLYGSYPDDKKKHDIWSDAQINISARKRKRKEPTFSCGGIGTTKTGMHYDLIIGDDLMSENNITTKEQIEKVITHYRLMLSLLDPGKPLIMIGTRWDYNDVYQYVLDYERDRFNVLVRKAYNPDGSLFFPERLTEKFLNETKKSQGSYIFSCQYLNEPVDDESATFKRSYIVQKPWAEVKDKPINWYLSVDPSYEGPYSDYTAFVLCGMDYQRELYVRDIMRRKMTYKEIIENMFNLYERYQPRQILLETIAHQKSLTYMLNNEQSRRGLWLPVTEIKSRTQSKEERIRGLAPYYEFGHVYHIKECNQLEDLEYELLHFPKGTHDDIIDAFASVLEFASPTNAITGKRKEEKRKRLKELYKPRSPIIGI